VGIYHKRLSTVEAFRWFHNGDHPKDGKFGEGKIVRYYCHPYIKGNKRCNKCGYPMHLHG